VKFFVDTADLAEIEEAASWGALAGVTTNPSLYARIGGKLADFPTHIQRICELTNGPVSAEATGEARADIIREGRELAALAPNVVVKVPTTIEGLAATRTLADEGIPVNMTLCFTVPQALLAARAGARYVSPFVGRFDDIAEDGIEQLSYIVSALSNYDFSSSGVLGPDGKRQSIEVIAASIRSVQHVTQAALLGADIATVPFNVLKKCVEHPLTTNGLAAFQKDWEKVTKA
jgi:transaldolase